MDSTAYLQNLIDSGDGIVRIPDGEYEVSAPLEVSDNTHIICSPRTHIRLADGSNCPLLMNRWKGRGEVTRNVTVEGGIWDGNNVGQDRSQYTLPIYYHWGQLMCFAYMENLTLRAMTVKDPNSYGIMLTDLRWFTVEDIYFDFNQKTYNQDGLHINGWAKDGHITNLKGNTNDDMVAFNSDEGDEYSENCDIENITVDGIYGGDYGWTAIRLLSRHANVKNISLRNIYGAYRFNAVSFTHWERENPVNCGHFDNIIIENVFATCCRKEGSGHGGLIWFQDDVSDAGTVIINNVLRQEDADKLNSCHTVVVGKNVQIDRLLIRNMYQMLPNDKPMFLIDETARIGELRVDGVLQK